MGDSDDDDYVDIGRPDLVGLLPDEIDELFSTIQPEHLELIVKDSDFEKAVGTTREGSFKLSDLVELELWNELSGPIRNQKRHILCWAYSSTDLVSALRICVDKDPTALAGHSCYGTTTRKAFQFMLDNGGVPKERTLEFDCNQDPPADPEPHITINSFATFNTLEEALVQLRTQPIGAEFSQLWELGEDMTFTMDLQRQILISNGEVIAICKSSNATLHMVISIADEETAEIVKVMTVKMKLSPSLKLNPHARGYGVHPRSVRT
ncbi:hypothetical protein Bca52824_075926 [Brassica carinata]|uniref:Peptidase C1A papain C-terminal domain-containing protein n=1 Tax=Brassica carinata TaxID=52824 RepID=A0A8X7PTT0_BRACI|nr:hypothetical protein Bca52824_075926 [Brassica carinata]